MAQNETYQAKIVNALQFSGMDQAERALGLLNKLADVQDLLKGRAKDAAKEITNLFAAFQKSKSPEDLANLLSMITGMGEHLKLLQKTASTVKLFDNKQLQDLKEYTRAIRELSSAALEMQKHQKIEKGTFGLDTTNVRDANAAIKVLNQNLAATKQAMDMSAGNAALKKSLDSQRSTIEKNLREMDSHVKGIIQKQQAEQTALWRQKENEAQALLKNQQAGKAREFSETETLKEELLKRREFILANERAIQEDLMRLRASYQLKLKQQAYDQSPEAMATVNGRFNVFQARQNRFGNNAYVGASISGLQRSSDAAILRDIYAQNQFRKESLLPKPSDASAIRDLMRQIAAIEREMVQSRKAGNSSLDDEKRKLEQIGKLSHQITSERRSATTISQTQQDEERAKQMLHRVIGPSGASLMAIQAVLRANYAIQNAVIGSLREGITGPIQLEAALKNLQAIAAITDKEMAGLGDTIKHVATTTKFNATEVANAAVVLGQAGLKAGQIAEAIGPVAQLATAAGASLDEAVGIVTSVIGVFDKSATDTADIANKITQAMNSSKANVSSFALALQYAGNVASQSGVSFEETTAAIAAMSNAGIKSGSTMGTGMRQFLTELQKPSEEFVRALHDMGLSLSDVDLKAKGLIGVLKTLKDAGFVATDAIQSFDVRSAAAFNALVADPDAVEQQLEGLRATAAASKANEIQMQSLENQLKNLGAAMGIVASTAFQPLITGLSAVTSGITSVLSVMSAWKPLWEIAGTLVAGLTARLGFLYVTSLLKSAAGFKELMQVLTGTAVAVEGTTAAMAGAATASVGFGTALRMLATSSAGWLAGLTLLVEGYFLFKDYMNKDAKAADDLRASLNQTSGAIDQKREALKVLNGRLEELQQYQANNVTEGSALRSVAADLTSSFAQFGFNVDINNAKLGEMQRQLRGVRERINELLLQDLQGSAAVAADVAQRSAEAAQKKLREQVTLTNNPVKDLLLQNRLSGNRLSPELVSTLKAANEEYKQGDIGNVGNIVRALPMLVQARTDMKTAEAKGQPIDQAMFRAIEDTLESMKSVQQVMAQHTQDVMELEKKNSEARHAQEVQDFKNKFNMSGVGFTDYIQRDSQLGKMLNILGGNDKDPQRRAKIAEQLYLEEKGRLNAVSTRVNEMQVNKEITPYAATEARQQIANAIREHDSEYFRVIQDSQISLTPIIKGALKQNALELQNLHINSKGMSEDQYTQMVTQNLQEKGRLMFQEQSASGKLLPGTLPYSNLKASIDEQIQQETQNEIDRFRKGLKEQAEKSARLELEALRKQIEGEMSLSTAAKRKATGKFTTTEDIQKFADESLAHLNNAMQLELQMEEKKLQGTDPKYMAGALDGVRAKYEGLKEGIISSISKSYDVAYKSMYDLSKKLKEIQQNIEQRSLEQEQKLYEQGQALRDNALTGARIQGRRGSQVEQDLNSRSRRPLEELDARRRITAAQDGISWRSGAIKSLDAALSSNTSSLAEAKAELETVKDLGDANTKVIELKSKIKQLEDANLKIEDQRNQYLKDQKQLRDEIYQQQLREAQNYSGPQSPVDFEDGLKKAWEAYKGYVKDINPTAELQDGLYQTLQNSRGYLTQFFTDVSSGAKSVGDAFRDMAISVVKALLDIAAQQLAIQIFKSVIGAFAGSYGGTQAAAPVEEASFNATVTAASGGYINRWGKLQRFASGGTVMGGTPGRDSVPAMLMPGEFVLKRSAVDALGVDFLQDLNQQGNAVVSTSQNQMSKGPQLGGSGGGVVNVWIVSKDQQPPPGPRDIIAVVTDDISRGGQVKKLIKQVQTGAV